MCVCGGGVLSSCNILYLPAIFFQPQSQLWLRLKLPVARLKFWPDCMPLPQQKHAGWRLQNLHMQAVSTTVKSSADDAGSGTGPVN